MSARGRAFNDGALSDRDEFGASLHCSGSRPGVPMSSPQQILSFVDAEPEGPWATYLAQIDRVMPYLGSLDRWVGTLRRPKRALIVDVPIEMDDGRIAHF